MMTTATMTPEKARSILIEAQKEHGDEPAVYEGEIPSEDEKAISEAEELVSMARDARDSGFEGEAITEVLALFEMDGGTPSDPNRRNGSVAKSQGVEEPIEGYAGMKVSEILKELPKLDEGQLADLYDYEKATKNRTTVINMLEEIASENFSGDPDDPNAEPEPETDEDGDELLPEPWRGYDKRKVDQIVRKLPKLDDDELVHVGDYEEQNKNRKAVMKAVEAQQEKRGMLDEDESGEEASSRREAEGEEGTEGAEGSEGADAEAQPDGEAEETGSEGSSAPAQEEEEDGAVEHHELISDVTARVEEEHLSVPQRPPEEKLNMPFDMTECSDAQIRKLHSAQTAYFARAAYVAKLERELEKACKHIADQKAGEILRTLPRVDKETKKEKNVTMLKNEVEEDPTVKKWREREFGHGQIATSFSKDCDIYDKNITSLSREWTMRHEELEHSGSLPNRRK